MKASDVFVKALENEGVKYIFGVPGEENLHLLDSIRKSSIKLIVTRHEQAAGFMAATIGRLTGTPGVCLSTLGPGATNLMTAVAYSQLGAMPAVFITGQKPIKNNSQGQFQIINTVEIMRPLTKMSRQIVSPITITATIREAFKTSMEERPGAVHIELPEDIAREEIEKPMFMSVNKIRRPIAEGKAILQTVKHIENAKSPLLLIGAGANRKRVSKMLTQFIDKTGIYFFTTQMGKGVVDERHKNYLGTAAFSSGDIIHKAIESADLIINIGHDTVEKPPFIDNKRVVHINFSSATPDVIYQPEVEVIGDIANAIWQITENIKVNRNWDTKKFEKIKEEIETAGKNTIDENLTIITEIRKALDEDDVVTLDNGLYKLWFSRYYKTYRENTLLLDNALATMGAGLPSAIAAKLLNPDKKVLTVVGDGGLMMNCQELETAVRLKLDMVVIVLQNNSFGMIEWKQKMMDLPEYGLKFGNPDFVKLAEAYGATGQIWSKDKPLSEIINQAYQDKRVQLIVVPIDYSFKLI